MVRAGMPGSPDATDGASTSRSSWLRFRVAESDYGIQLDSVAEVVAANAPHLVPLIRLEIGGVLNVRGEPLPVVDGGAVLRGRSCYASRHALVFEREDQRLGVLVDYVLKIDRDLDPARLDELDPGQAEQLCTSAWRRSPEGGALGIVDSDALLTRAASLLAGGSLQKEEPCPNAY